MKYKIRNKRYCCDVDNCSNYAHAELYHLGKSGWMYVCKKHYELKLNKKSMPKEKDIGFCILAEKEKFPIK